MIRSLTPQQATGNALAAGFTLLSISLIVTYLPYGFCGANNEGAFPRPGIPLYSYEIIDVYPHDPEAFTQGLIYHGGFLYESTGNYGRSSLRKVDLASGRVLKIHRLPDNYILG
jgi:glutamine cyclotransferase